MLPALDRSPTAQHITSNAVASSSNDVPRFVRRRTTPAGEGRHRRRASQPASSSLLSLPSPKLGDDSDRWTSSSGNDDGNSSGEDDEWEDRRESLAYLDLSLTLPYALVSLRTQLLAHCSQLEQRVRSLCQFAPPVAVDAGSDSHFKAAFYAHLDALKEDLRKLALYLPSSASPFTFPISPQRARQSLAEDWERLSTAVQVSLPVSADLHLALPNMSSQKARDFFPAFSPLADLDFTAVLSPLAAHLPVSGLRLLETLQARIEVLQDSVSTLTLRDCFYWSKRSGEDDHQVGTSGKSNIDNDSARPVGSMRRRRMSLSTSHQLLSRQFDSILESIKEKGEEVRAKGHARAASVAKAAKETEERLYAAALELARGGQRLIRYEQLPTLWKNNEHILSGYRFIPSDDMGALLRSTFEIHNETGNIMTHLVGALIVTPLFWPSTDQFDEQTTPMDRMVQTIYLVAALKCLILSVSWHVMAGCSNACLFERFACVDYTGIAWLVAASVWTLVYNAFYCQPNLAMFYSLTTLLVGAVGAIVPWAAWFNDRENKPIRIAIFLTMCFTGVGPFVHASLSHGFVKTSLFFSPILPSVASYVFGLIFYATQFPERIAPGRFDVFGHAHQIWHISIVVAILLHYRATFMWHQGRFDFSCTANSLGTSSSIANLGQETAEMAGRVASTLFTDKVALRLAAADLNVADDIVHGWRISLGKVGDGMVGRVWDWCVDRLMAKF